MSKNKVLLPNSMSKETEVIAQLDQIKSTINYGKSPSNNSDTTAVVTEQTDFPTFERVTTNYKELSENLSTGAITTDKNSINSTQITEVTSDGTTKIYSETLPATEVSSTETILDNLKFLVMHENFTEPITMTDTTITAMASTDTEKEITNKGNDNQTETMTVEASSSVTNNPSWKTYTTIERKHTSSAEREENTVGTEQNELLTKAETVPATISLENAANYTSIPSLNELRQELINNSKTYNTRSDAEALTSLPNEQPSISSPAPVSSSPSISDSDTGPDNIVTSKRAGFLDLTIKQTDSKDTTTTDSSSLNEKEFNGTMFEVDLQENDDSTETKNVSESQRQMVEDAIKEKLLEEELLNDNYVKSYQRESKSSESSEGTIEPLSDDSLSVKPISPKSSIYTVSPHYKKMKKIEVQPLKPFIRDPDDNSWRNESLSLLGIVFKAKNASKPFTQVLKNKTEAELNNVSEKDEKYEVTDLRERLGKIAEVRKSRKKKINKTGDTVYSDYEEGNSVETYTTPKTETILPVLNPDGKLAFVGQTTYLTPVKPESSTTPGVYMYKEEILTTNKPKQNNKFAEYYDTTDEYDADYVTLPKLDLKKFTTSFYNKDTATTPPMLLTTHAKSLTTYWPDRKPTVQYFPPRPQRPMLNLNDYDRGFEKKVNMFSVGVVPKNGTQARTVGTIPIIPPRESKQQLQPNPDSVISTNKTTNLFKNVYATIPSRVVEPGDRYSGADDETFNRASYVIKHYKDLIDEAVKGDYDKNGEYVQPYTDSPLTGVTVDEGKGRFKLNLDDDYDYVSNFRKDILNKFVDTFNKNSERFKVDFPILYNSSVVHRQAQDDGRVLASSSAFLKRQYGDLAPRACEPNCDLKVELSPAYELHYYVPDQEEREEVHPKQPPLPYTYRL